MIIDVAMRDARLLSGNLLELKTPLVDRIDCNRIVLCQGSLLLSYIVFRLTHAEVSARDHSYP